MIAGHFGLAAAVKAKERQAPLWALMFATVWLDIVFVPLFLSGVETMEPAAGLKSGYGANIIHAGYTHSLVGAITLSMVLGSAAYAVWGRRVGIVIGLVSFSHWILDILVHRGDMPILPRNLGDFRELGFGLWAHPAWAAASESALVILGSWLYWRAARAVTSAAGVGKRRATLVSLLILIGGFGVLLLDFTGGRL